MGLGCSRWCCAAVVLLCAWPRDGRRTCPPCACLSPPCLTHSLSLSLPAAALSEADLDGRLTCFRVISFFFFATARARADVLPAMLNAGFSEKQVLGVVQGLGFGAQVLGVERVEHEGLVLKEGGCSATRVSVARFLVGVCARRAPRQLGRFAQGSSADPQRSSRPSCLPRLLNLTLVRSPSVPPSCERS